ncbi:type I-E CRISPR-associated protein Cse1/CasA [Marinobacterium arenosum]|uniref:type I-E CRISPR-associated protein Cse1/CasA n=1 Tax=Marinobacterium arenosum TaxID=2862496 RepID=UPI001C973448|nr:type I-E CRISPR-associated protein Cse1/CasA [Marinobacterium arenosum]MBY4678208.1 type I-E CRISPR-associated protein Cse1/CasA [Marinobacterium arenosum]
MNLIEDRWIPVIRQDGGADYIAPWQIAEPDNPPIELNAPRPDFQGALYQLLIGLLQTVYAPQEARDWEALYEAPEPAELQRALARLTPAMQLLQADGPAFLQDFDLPDGETKPIAGLLIDAPGGKTLKDNLDHFIKGGRLPQLCHSCAASALFTLQTNAPSGGVGHRVGLRGGGPLTTLIRPAGPATLWQKLWLNVLTCEELPAAPEPLSAKVLPWMGPTRLSDQEGLLTTPDDGHPLQMYWGMPRRIRLHPSDRHGCCALCGGDDQPLITEYRTRNYGINYSDHWLHPLTPYRFDPKQKNPPRSLKGQPGGLCYRHWVGLALGRAGNGDTPAKVVAAFNGEREELLAEASTGRLTPRLWCFGYDMDNMKARCWYDHDFPLFSCDADRQEKLLAQAEELLDLAQLAVRELRGRVRDAWFKRALDAKGDTSHIEADFWQQTEARFFALVQQLGKLPPSEVRPATLMLPWSRMLVATALDSFDRWTLESNPEDLNLKRIMAARAELLRKLRTSKPFKAFAARYPEPEKETA